MTALAATIPARFLRHAELRPSRDAYYEWGDHGWAVTSWRDYVGEVRAAAKALREAGVERGGKVAMLGFNRPEWVIMAMASMCIGAVPVGIYTTCSAHEVAYIVRHSESSVVLVENQEQWQKIKDERDSMPQLRTVVAMRRSGIDDDEVSSWEWFLRKGGILADDVVDTAVAAIEPQDLATLIYTSGTTGPPKAVMLSHEALAWTSARATELLSLSENDSALSYLPLSHIAEQMFTIHGPATVGSAVYFARSMETLAEDLKNAQPTLFFGVPRVWEKFHAAVSDRLEQARGIKRSLAQWAMSVGRAFHALAAESKPVPSGLRLQYRLAGKLVFSKLKPALGLGRARVCVSGAAPIASSVLEFFAGLDVVVQEVYGQSEDCGPTTFNRAGATRFGTVGQPFPGLTVRIAEDHEILVQGPSLFMGYYKDPETTAQTLVDGWLHSGDLGQFDDAGYLRITGRKKDIIITAGGKNITPSNIEGELMQLELVEQAVVIGDRRRYLTALITLDEEAVARFAQERSLAIDTIQDHPELLQLIQSGIDVVNGRLARVETVRKFRILASSFSIDSGELTPTLKIRRTVVAERYAAAIEAMYQ